MVSYCRRIHFVNKVFVIRSFFSECFALVIHPLNLRLSLLLGIDSTQVDQRRHLGIEIRVAHNEFLVLDSSVALTQLSPSLCFGTNASLIESIFILA